jgi:hypothetical protein
MIYNQAAFVAYGNKAINGGQPAIQEAFKADFKKNLKLAGYPSEMEVKNGALDNVTFDMSKTIGQIPNLVTSYMADENAVFKLPSPNPGKVATAVIKPFHFEEKEHTGTTSFGGETKEYKTITGEYDGYKLKNNTAPFKQK